MKRLVLPLSMILALGAAEANARAQTPTDWIDPATVQRGIRLSGGRGGASLALVVTDLKTGEAKKIHYSTEWLNHLQASPADPQRVLFCHEGTWHEVDRVWTIRTDGSGLRLLHRRTMPYEIAGHEFFG